MCIKCWLPNGYVLERSGTYGVHYTETLSFYVYELIVVMLIIILSSFPYYSLSTTQGKAERGISNEVINHLFPSFHIDLERNSIVLNLSNITWLF